MYLLPSNKEEMLGRSMENNKILKLEKAINESIFFIDQNTRMMRKLQKKLEEKMTLTSCKREAQMEIEDFCMSLEMIKNILYKELELLKYKT
jgi:hypothetical protein